MKNIKFRAWDGKAKVMVLWPRFLHEASSSIALETLFAGEWLPIMQFTGLLDRHGKEIYEGDILRCISEKVRISDNKPTGEIVTKIKTIEWQDEWSRFQFKRVADGQFELLPCTKQEWVTQFYEVIGNIYENPELLTP